MSLPAADVLTAPSSTRAVSASALFTIYYIKTARHGEPRTVLESVIDTHRHTQHQAHKTHPLRVRCATKGAEIELAGPVVKAPALTP